MKPKDIWNLSTISLRTNALDFAGNLNRIQTTLDSIIEKNTDIFLFPELCLSGYGCEDAFYFPWVWEKSLLSLKNLLPLSSQRIVSVGLPLFVSPFLYNVQAILVNGELVALIPKQNLANTGIHYESRWFQSGGLTIQSVPIWDTEVPFGPLIVEAGGLRIGFEICEDSWVLHRPAKWAVDSGADLILSPGASHFAMGKAQTRRELFCESSRLLSGVVAFSNLLGNETGRSIYDGGSLVAGLGKILAEDTSSSLKDHISTQASFSLTEVRSYRSKNLRYSPGQQSTRTELPTVSVFFQDPLAPALAPAILTVSKRPNQDLSSAFHTLPNAYQEFSTAVSTGLWDYLLKSKAKGFTLSISGGADSMACAILVDMVKKRVQNELGDRAFQKHGLEASTLLRTIYQKMPNNSTTTQSIASTLATELSVPHLDISIETISSENIEVIQKATGIEISWENHDIALQNIQARVRSPLVWLLANLHNHLLLSTGNRSEASVGYTTMDGDSSGSLAPLAGVSKPFLLEWLQVLYEGGGLPKGITQSPYQGMKSLELLFTTKPSAELKPLHHNQEDEKDLMPYPLLQFFEEALVHRCLDLHTIPLYAEEAFPDISRATLQNHWDRFRQLFARSQWKRERLPPSFHLDGYGLDPKTSFRFPILSYFS